MQFGESGGADGQLAFEQRDVGCDQHARVEDCFHARGSQGFASD